jgi:DnaJ-class molecular chaperone
MKTLERSLVTITDESESDCTLCGGTGKLAKQGGGTVTCSWCGGSGQAGTDPRDALIIEAAFPRCKHSVRMDEYCAECAKEMEALPDPD